jgi:hypothetical protein
VTTESKLKTGSLTLGDAAVEFACQATNVIISTEYTEDGDSVEVLCGTALSAPTTIARKLKVTAIQDFDDPAGFMRFLRQHELQTVPFAWQASPTSEIAAGMVQCRLGDWGGDVNKRLTTAPELPIVGEVFWTPPEPVPATRAIAGTPGVWLPTGSQPPATLAAMTGITATPTAVWSTGQHVLLRDGTTKVFWDGAAWAAGQAP